MKNLKQALIEAAEHYERRAHRYLERAEQDKIGQKQGLMEAHKYSLGMAKAMREALEYVEEFLG